MTTLPHVGRQLIWEPVSGRKNEWFTDVRLPGMTRDDRYFVGPSSGRGVARTYLAKFSGDLLTTNVTFTRAKDICQEHYNRWRIVGAAAVPAVASGTSVANEAARDAAIAESSRKAVTAAQCLQDRARDSRKRLDEWAAKFATNPANAFEWSNARFHDAAQFDVCRDLATALAGDPTRENLGVLIDCAADEVRRRSERVPASTSPTLNLMDHYRLAAWAGALSILRGRP